MPTPRNLSAGEAGSSAAGRRPITDGGETFCVACGEAFNPERDACPACGRPVDGEDDGGKADAGEGDADDARAEGEPDGTAAEMLEGAAAASTTGSTAESDTAEAEPEPATDPEQTTETTGSAEAEHAESPETDDESHGSARRPDDAAGSRGRPNTAGPNEEYCTECGAVVGADADRCPHCGTDRTDSGKRPILAGVMSFFLPGSGQMYTGRIKRGAALLVVALILYAGRVPFVGVGLPGAGPDSVPFLGFAAWAAFDAYTGTKAVNAA